MKEAAIGVSWTLIDWERATVTIARTDGMVAVFPVRVPQPPDPAVKHSLWDCNRNRLSLMTRANELIVFELPTSDASVDLGGRLIVYLDQNQWSLVAAALSNDDDVEPAQLAAAKDLHGWVSTQRIVLPASAGHFNETTRWSDSAARYRLGLTILRMSRGWQMRHPLRVRDEELHELFAHQEPTTPTRYPSVISCAPGALNGGTAGSAWSPPEDFQSADQLTLSALIEFNTFASLMLDPDAIPRSPQPGWASNNQAFSDWLDAQPLDRQQKRREVTKLAMVDLAVDIARALVAADTPAESLGDWTLGRWAKSLSGLPSTGLFVEMLQSRHATHRIVWRENDLTDMFFLSNAAAYSDVVVCEAHMGEVLKQGTRRLGRGASIFTNLADAVAAIRSRLEEGEARGALDLASSRSPTQQNQ